MKQRKPPFRHPLIVARQDSTTATRAASGPFVRTLERQIEEIMAQASPRRRPNAAAAWVVTVVFVQIKGFAGLCETLEPPDLGALLDIYLGTVADSIGTFLGTVHNSMSDLVMATWNAAYPQPDHALLGVNSAIGLVERIDDVGQRLQIEGLPPIACGIGVNTGNALLRAAGSGRRENDVIGDTVNVARLLAELACDNTILIGEGTHVSVGDGVRTEPTDIVQLDGKSQRVRVFKVLGRPEIPDTLAEMW